jgi:NTE family protein
VRPGLLLAGLTNAGTVDTAPIEDAFDRVVGERWPDPVTWICAVDLDSGERATFGSPSAPVVGLGRAVAASCAVPSYFAPVVVSLPMGMAGPPGRRGVDLPGRRLNSKGAAAGLRPLVVAGVPVLVVEPTAAELAVMHYDAFDNAHLGDVAARSGATLAARIRRRLPADAAALAALGI